jgi:hypothetical protein
LGGDHGVRGELLTRAKIIRCLRQQYLAALFCFRGNNLRSAEISSSWSFKLPLEATLAALFTNFVGVEVT